MARHSHIIQFSCRHCEETFSVWMRWKLVEGKVIAEKVGEVPRPEIGLPVELENALGKYSEFWRRGMGLRHHGAGIGALAYFRRIVEGTTRDLLDLLARAMEIAEDPAETVEMIRGLVRGQTTYDKKVEQASKVLPPRYRPGGANPLKTIFEVVSDGLHSRTDEECCDLVDALAEAMAFLFAKLNEDINSHKTLADAVKEIEALRKK